MVADYKAVGEMHDLLGRVGACMLPRAHDRLLVLEHEGFLLFRVRSVEACSFFLVQEEDCSGSAGDRGSVAVGQGGRSSGDPPHPGRPRPGQAETCRAGG